ncbi:MAG: hypothetical protein GXO83_04670 [Chlorobi bacterium]|nr:hypothetical protein [Chlorobiota bacterium]
MTVRKISKNTVVKHPVSVFIVMSIFISWLFWSPIIASSVGLLNKNIEITSIGGFLLYIIAMTSMWIVAIPLIVARQGIEGVKNAYKDLFSGRNKVLWFFVAILIPIVIEIIAPIIIALPTGKLDLSGLSWSYVLFILVLGIHLSLVLALGGTGYALQLFAEGRGRITATLLTSTYTVVWISPMYLDVILRHPGYPVSWYFLGSTPALALILWLYYSASHKYNL